jgi:hypothetical protein
MDLTPLKTTHPLPRTMLLTLRISTVWTSPVTIGK